MPELPEVVVLQDKVEHHALHKRIDAINIKDSSIIEGSVAALRGLKGKSFESVERCGKYLALIIDKNTCLVMHFGMSGKLEFGSVSDLPSIKTQVTFEFVDKHFMAYYCPRKFGFIRVVDSFENFLTKHDVGPDFLSLTQKQFVTLLGSKHGMIKPTLMDQSLFSGIGNVYADEALYQLNIHPETSIDTLSAAQKVTLYKKLHAIIKVAIKNKGDRDNYPPSYLVHARTAGAACPNGKGRIKKITIGGRSTYICPATQKKE